MSIQELGFEVVEPLIDKRTNLERIVKLSRRYIVRSAADTACGWLRTHGHPTAYVHTVQGLEGLPGTKRKQAAAYGGRS